MKDYVIHNLAWHLAGDPRGEEVVEDLVMAYTPLMAWLKEKGLISNRELVEAPVDKNLEIKVSDLTPEGYELFMIAHERWLQAVDRIPIGEMTEEKTNKKIKSIWEKYYRRLKT